METLDACGLLLALGLSMGCSTPQTTPTINHSNNAAFIGSWNTEGEPNAQGVPITSFSIQVIEANERIVGEYCYISNYGNRIDCDNAFSGHYIGKNSYKIQFSSQFGGGTGQAAIQLKQDKLYWALLQAPQHGEYTMVERAVLEKAPKPSPF